MELWVINLVYGLISRNGVLRTSYNLDHIGIFGRKVEDVAMLAKVLIKKDKFDPATIHYSTENILSETKKDLYLILNLFFIKLNIGN